MDGLEWIAADWGTSNLRVWALDGAGAVMAQAGSDKGMGRLERDQYEAALLALVGDWLPEGRETPVMVCGMAGARQGWVEAPYLTVPCRPGDTSIRVTTHDPRLSVRILPGVCQMNPADVMRGEETQIRGVLRTNPGFSGVICLPGTHSKWVDVAGGQIVRFKTYMTGELFALLGEQSVLRHSVGADGMDGAAFAAGVRDGVFQPQRVLGSLFSLRAQSLLNPPQPAAARARLSGLLIGAELADAEPFWKGREVILLGAPALAKAYETALAVQGVEPERADNDRMTLAGLQAAYGSQKDAANV